MSKPTMCNVQHGTWNVQSSTFTLQKINAQCTESLISSQPWGALGLANIIFIIIIIISWPTRIYLLSSQKCTIQNWLKLPHY